MGRDVTPHTLIEAGLGSELLSSLGASISHFYHWACTSALGFPIGSNEYTAAFTERSIEEARRILKLISNLLLIVRDSTRAPNNTSIFSPDEHNCLMRSTVRSRVTHFLRTLPPNTASQKIDRLHSEMLNSHLNDCPAQSVSHETNQSFILCSPHLDVRKVVSLPLALGGHGFLPFNNTPPYSPLQSAHQSV